MSDMFFSEGFVRETACSLHSTEWDVHNQRRAQKRWSPARVSWWRGVIGVDARTGCGKTLSLLSALRSRS